MDAPAGPLRRKAHTSSRFICCCAFRLTTCACGRLEALQPHAPPCNPSWPLSATLAQPSAYRFADGSIAEMASSHAGICTCPAERHHSHPSSPTTVTTSTVLRSTPASETLEAASHPPPSTSHHCPLPAVRRITRAAQHPGEESCSPLHCDCDATTRHAQGAHALSLAASTTRPVAQPSWRIKSSMTARVPQ